MSSPLILVVDDEEDLRKVLEFNLVNAGFQTHAVATGQEAFDFVEEVKPDLILLDIMLPDIQGTQICKELKTQSRTRDIPIIMLTARSEEIDRVVGFELGADDYVVKPFSVRELILRVRAILKRASVEPEPELENLVFGPILMDLGRHRVFIDEKEVKLTATEFRLLETFLSHRGRVQTRDNLLQDVWGADINVTPRTVDTHVKRLREKLKEAGSYVETVRGVGYRFSEKP